MVCEDAVAIMNQEFVLLKTNRLAQLLQRPSRTWMGGDVAMDQTAAAMLDHYEHIQQAKRRGDGDEEITRMIPWACRRKKVDQRKSPLGRPRGRRGRYFRTVRADIRIPSFRRNSLAMRSSPHKGFSFAIRRIRAWICCGIGGRPGRDFKRQNNLHPARRQRIIVSGRTTTRASRQLKNRDRNARAIRVIGSIRLGLTPRSI